MTPVAQWALWSVVPCPTEALAWLQGTWLYPWVSTGVSWVTGVTSVSLAVFMGIHGCINWCQES